MKASVTCLFLVMGFILLLMHVDLSQSTANHHSNPRYDRILKGKQQSPPPPSSSRLNHQESPRSPGTPGHLFVTYPPPPRPPPPPPPAY
ncbi:hypothetical protein ACP275_06G071600 [Erythranthe tilingii]